MRSILGIDIGGTTVKLAMVRAGEKYQVISPISIDTLSQEPGEQIVARIAKASKELIAKVGDKVVGIGMGCPGLINNIKGHVMVSANLPTFKDFDLGPALERQMGLPVALQNDANAAALGEFQFGESRGCNNIVLLTLGTGVGGGVISDGKLVVGADNAATELGHVKVEYHDPAPCGCGTKGCVEAYLGMKGIQRIAQTLKPQFPFHTAIHELSTREIADRARAGDLLALKTLHLAGKYLGRGIAAFIDIFNPEKVVLAGGASKATDLLMPGIQESLKALCPFDFTRERAIILASAIPGDINVLGAAAVYLNAAH